VPAYVPGDSADPDRDAYGEENLEATDVARALTVAVTIGGHVKVIADIGRLLISCDDRPGIVAAVSGFLFERGANIVESDQYSTDPEGGRFYLRMVFHLAGLADTRERLEDDFERDVARPLGLEWRLSYAAQPKRAAVMVSREDHCLLDLLWRRRRGELDLDIGLVVSNHTDLAGEVARFGVPFEHVPVTPDTKAEAEARELELMAGRFDLVLLARYMQILSRDFLDRLGAPVINIHHSFLPAFPGADPYGRAKRRGVKLIGATAHYVTEHLDDGPIIEQDVIRVSHGDDVDALQRLGADIERTVFLRAVRWHCEDRVLAHGNTTVVFS
jgi:formyltetrahydrofolate deformylase